MSVILTAILAVAPGMSDTSGTGDVKISPNQTQNGPVTAAGSVQLPSVGFCYGRTENVHTSNSVLVSVHSRTICPSASSAIASTNLQRDRWYGWEQLANGSSAIRTQDANTKWYCAGTNGWYDYQASSYRCATIGTQNLIGYTGDTKRLFCL